MISCNGKETKPSQNKNNKFKIDTLEFISYKDKNDEAYFVVKEGDNNLSFEFLDSTDRHFNRGDLLEIKWSLSKNKNAFPLLLSAKKIKDGITSIFLKENKIRIQYTWKSQLNGGFISKSYSIVEYYLSVTQNKIAKQAILDLSKNDKNSDVKIGNKIIDYIVEKDTIIDGKKLGLLDIGIFTYGSGNNRQKIQNIFYENETYKIYELDSNSHKLSEIVNID